MVRILAAMAALAVASPTSPAHPPKPAPQVSPPSSTADAPRQQIVRQPEHHVVPESGLLDADDLVEIVKTALSASDDQFSADPSTKYLGRPFVAVLDHDALAAKYDRESQTLKFEASIVDGWPLESEEEPQETVDGQNSYGAKIVFVRSKVTKFTLNSVTSVGYSDYSFTLPLEGEAARAMSKAVRVRMFGYIAKSEVPPAMRFAQKPEMVSNGAHVHAATLTEPYDRTVVVHRLNVHMDKIEAYDARDSHVLYSWNH